MSEEKLFKVKITGTWEGDIYAETAEQAEEIAFRDEFDPAYLKEKISCQVEEVTA